MTLRDFVASLQKHWVLVILTTFVATLGSGLASHFSTPTYTSSASLYFSLNAGQSAADINQGSTYTQNQMLSFAQLATLPVVLDPVITKLSLPVSARELASSISATTSKDTVILVVSADGGTAESATALATAVSEQLVTVTESLAPRDTNGKSTVSVKIVEAAQAPQFPSSPNTKRNVLAGFVIGLLLGILVAYLRDVLDTRVRDTSDVEDLLDLPVLASLSRTSVAAGMAFVEEETRGGHQAEEYRRLRANLQFLGVDADDLCLLVSSSLAGEGKTTTITNLAIALAEAGSNVLLIDADLRSPRVGRYLGLESAAGLTTVLIGRASVNDVLQPWGSQSLTVLTSGEVPPNPSALLATRALSDLIASMRKRYDVVLIDAPPLLPVADAAILSRLVSGVVLVADSRRVRRAQLRESSEAVRSAGGLVLGVVLNKVKPRRSKGYRYESD